MNPFAKKFLLVVSVQLAMGVHVHVWCMFFRWISFYQYDLLVKMIIVHFEYLLLQTLTVCKVVYTEIGGCSPNT